MTDLSSDRARKSRVLAAVCIASGTMPMTFTGPAVALGSIADAFGAAPSALPWVTNAFMLAFGSALMAAGAMADRHGRKRVFLIGIAVFLLASVGLTAAPDMRVFDLLRGLQGLGGAAIFAGGAAALAQEFDDDARVRAFSLLGTSFGIGLVLGPVVAGQLSAAFGWRAIFALVIATSAFAGLLGQEAMRPSRDPQAHTFDWWGAASFTAGLTLVTAAVLTAAENGWQDARVIGGFLAAAAAFGLFVAIERRSARPMLDLSLFRYRRFLGIQLLAAAPAYAFVVLLVFLPMRFAGIEGLGQAHVGWLMATLSAPLTVLPLAAGLLARRFSAATLCAGGLLVAATGLLWLACADRSAAAIPAMLLIGIGISLPWGLMDGLAVSVVPRERAGMATGIFSTTRVAGEGLALAIVGTTLAALIRDRLPADSRGPVAAAAQSLASGRLAAALDMLPGSTASALSRAYEQAFSTLLVGLAGVTTATALFVWLSLARRETGTSVPGTMKQSPSTRY